MNSSLSDRHAVEDPSQVASARRAASRLAETVGFSEEDAGRVALAVSEAATNLLKHAGRGTILLRLLQAGEIAGVEVLSLDRGPGLANAQASIRDGHSTAGTLGGGLGALSRLSDCFDLYSVAGQGAAFRMEFWPARAQILRSSCTFGAVCVALRGEIVSGDDWYVQWRGSKLSILVADGLGHGPDAARAARAAVQTLIAHPDAAPSQLLAEGHRLLAGTRGAAVSIAQVDPAAQTGTFAGIGNVVARVVPGAHSRHFVTHNGTLGFTAPRIQEFPLPFPHASLLIMHSDGIGTHWDLSAYPGLHLRHPGLIAGVLYRDYDRGRDDATIVVVRNEARD